MEVSFDWVRVGCGVRLISGAFPLRSGEAWGEGTPVPVPRVTRMGGDAPSGVSIHSSDDEMSQSKTVGLGSGCQAGGRSLPASTFGLWAEAAATSARLAQRLQAPVPEKAGVWAQGAEEICEVKCRDGLLIGGALQGGARWSGSGARASGRLAAVQRRVA